AYQDWLTFFPTDPLADRVMLKMAEADMRQMGLSDRDVTRARKAEQRLKALLQQFPQTQLRPAVMEHLYQVQENLGMHNLQIARFYVGRQEHGRGGLKGAQDRLREILQKYTNFSYMDEVLMRLGSLYMEEEEPDEAAKYFQQLVRDYPNSEYVQKATEQLQLIGATVPAPDPVRQRMPVAQRPGMMENILRQVSGIADVDVDKNGVIISHDSHATDDLIDLGFRNNGQLPGNIPNSIRTPPAHQVAPQQQNQQPADSQQRTGGTSIRLGSQQGPIPSTLNPSVTPPPPTVPQSRPQPQQAPTTSTVVPAPSPTPASTPPGSQP
ncbi:MAG TPA: outer membrane protein assembly factor BamD, partial [Pyrinomonadaceae bacterium]|nr:outer membrane protein assembly factor BamD [Pyrinomonadaceae bacterium]